MQVTEVRLFKNEGEDREEAYGSITLDGAFAVSGIKVMRSNEGQLFIGYPTRRNSKGDYKNICFPMTKALREDIEMKVLAKFEEL